MKRVKRKVFLNNNRRVASVEKYIEMEGFVRPRRVSHLPRGQRTKNCKAKPIQTRNDKPRSLFTFIYTYFLVSYYLVIGAAIVVLFIRFSPAAAVSRKVRQVEREEAARRVRAAREIAILNDYEMRTIVWRVYRELL